MENSVMQLTGNLLAVLIPVLVGMGIEYLRRSLGSEKLSKLKEELETKQLLAMLAVKFVQQAYQDLAGPEKYNKAAEWLAARATEYGLKLTTEEIKGLIEAALRTLKDQLGEEWAKI